LANNPLQHELEEKVPRKKKFREEMHDTQKLVIHENLSSEFVFPYLMWEKAILKSNYDTYQSKK
jgi:hypothetical protein